MAAFKNEKEWNAWLAANPKAAARMQAMAPAEAIEISSTIKPRVIKIVPQLATSHGTSVVVKLPARGAASMNRRNATSRFDRAMAWVFVGVVAAGSVGVVATVSAMLALEYLR